MRTVGLAIGMAVLVAACGGTEEGGGSGGTGALTGLGGSGGSGGASGSGGSSDTGGSGGWCDDGGSGGQGSVPGYAQDIRPIFEAKCTNGACHAVATASRSPGPALDYADVTRSAPGCSHGDRLYGCVLDAVEQGVMPLGGGCSGDPARDAGKRSCLTAPELDNLRRWVEAGGPP